MQKILVLAALPDRLRLDKESREIEDAIKRAVKRDLFEIRIRTAVRPQDIRRALAEERPQIVHFCGHGMEDGSLVLEDDGGNHKCVLPAGLASLFKLHTDYVKCVLLNACYSSKSAETISQHINYVIGMNQPIEDRAAIVFAQGFYDGLGYDNINNKDVIQRAFDEGIVAIELENILQNSVPVLWESGIIQRHPKPTENVVSWEHNNFNRKAFTQAFELKHQPKIETNKKEVIETPSTSENEQEDSGDDLSSERGIDYTSNTPVKVQTQSPPNIPQKPATASKQENIKNPSPQVPTTPCILKTLPPQLPSKKNLADDIQKLPRGREYPVYQVFGVICSFYQHGIATPPEILPLCLPEYSKQAVQKVIDGILNNELKNLVIFIAKGRFERLGISDNINLQKAIQIYPLKSLEKYLITAIPTLDADQEIHQRWASHCLRSLATNGEDNLVLKVLQDYPDKIKALKPKDGSSELSVWIKIYEALRQKHPEDETIRSEHLGLVSRYGTEEQKRNLINETKPWLLKNSEDRIVRRLYLALVFQSGNQQQQQDAIAQTSTWLEKNSSALQRAISQDPKIRTELIRLLQTFINNLEIDNYPKSRKNYHIIFTIFEVFRDYLNNKSCDALANCIVQYTLDIPIKYWVHIINAATIFRCFHSDFDKAEKIYIKVLNAAKSELKKSGANLQEIHRILRYTSLHYACLLIQIPSPKPDEAIKYLRYVIDAHPKHGLANLYMAQCYQLKGANFYPKVREHYQRAIDLDKEQTGYFWYEFGCFYRYIFKNAAQARNCFEESLKQKKNLGAYVELADLEAGNNKFSGARELLQQGRNLERITRRDKHQWQQLERRIQDIDSRSYGNLSK